MMHDLEENRRIAAVQVNPTDRWRAVLEERRHVLNAMGGETVAFMEQWHCRHEHYTRASAIECGKRLFPFVEAS